jgi:hypothetical protein
VALLIVRWAIARGLFLRPAWGCGQLVNFVAEMLFQGCGIFEVAITITTAKLRRVPRALQMRL